MSKFQDDLDYRARQMHTIHEMQHRAETEREQVIHALSRDYSGCTDFVLESAEEVNLLNDSGQIVGTIAEFELDAYYNAAMGIRP